MNFIHPAVVKGNLSHSAATIYEANVVLEEKFPYTENPFLLSCWRKYIFVFFFYFCLVFVLFIELHDFRNLDSVVEIGRLFQEFRMRWVTTSVLLLIERILLIN